MQHAHVPCAALTRGVHVTARHQGKFPLKTDDAINDLLAKRLAGHVYEEEWVDIIKYMYNHEDSLALIVMVNDLIQATQQQQSTAPAPRRRRDAKDREPAGPKGRVRFKAFLKVLLDFQLKGHQRFLAKFHAMFCDVDRDANGVVDEGTPPSGGPWESGASTNPRLRVPVHRRVPTVGAGH